MTASREVLRVLAALSLVVLLANGCVTPAGRLNELDTARVHPGMTEAEVAQLFGVPKRSVFSSTGRKLEMYATTFRRPTAFSALTQPNGVYEVRALHVLYDAEGKVLDSVYSAGEAHYRISILGNRESGAGISRAELKQIQPGVTTREQATRLLGPPTTRGLDSNANPTLSWVFVRDRERHYLRLQELIVTFDAQSIVRGFELSEINL